jgi:hypothetical protein
MKLLSVTLVALYAFVFIASNYLHHHHENTIHNTQSFAKDNSCDLCDASPAKLFNANDIAEIEFLTLPVFQTSSFFKSDAQQLVFSLNNKAPPVLA